MQVTHFKFSNESYLSVYNGNALAAQYAYALAQWALQLKAILPNMKLGANGLFQLRLRRRAGQGAEYWCEVVVHGARFAWCHRPIRTSLPMRDDRILTL